MQESLFTRDIIIQMFKDNKAVNVTFFKTDGSIREMKCTRNEEVISEYETINQTKTLENPLNQIRVFSLGNKGWRSFLVENVIDISGA